MVAAVLGLIIVAFVITVIRQQGHNLKLQQQYALSEISIMEKERARIGTDIHDELGPLLSVIKFRISSIQTNNAEDRSEMNIANQQLDDAIRKMRTIANNLVPVILQRKGLIIAIEQFLDEVESASKLKIKFMHDLNSVIPEQMSLNVYRIIQELVHNCIKHAKASSGEIALKEEDGSLLINYNDNGVGFEHEEKLNDTDGIGLRSIRNRAELMSGKIKVHSSKDEGTTYKITIPIK
jgi:signal transduction histidine kinase